MIDSKQELFVTQNRVLYSNKPSADNIPNARLRGDFAKRISDKDLGIFPIPPKVNVNEFTDYLFANPELNKIHSTTLDTFETLPFRPDISFDSMWRAFEALVIRYAKDQWSILGNSTDTIATLSRICNEALKPVISHSGKIETSLGKLIKAMPVSIGRFALVRMLFDREIKISSQFGYVSQRSRSILGNELYEKFIDRYVDNGTLLAKNHYSGALKIARMVNGERLTFNEKETKGIPDNKRWEFIISVILYTSRCERYHGDFFSPFMSSLAKMDTYRHWYWLLTITMSFFWILMKKYTDITNPELITDEKIAASIDYNTKIINCF